MPNKHPSGDEGPTVTPAPAADNYPPEFVRRNCELFLDKLDNYSEIVRRFWLTKNLSDYTDPKTLEIIAPPAPRKAASLYARLVKLASELLCAGNAWDMTGWLQQHVDWLPIERHDFFEDSDDGASDHMARYLDPSWGLDLSSFIGWRKDTGAAFGFSGRESENDDTTLNFVFNDIGRDVRCLLAAANERALGRAIAPPPLTELEALVLSLIPVGGEKRITGKELIAAIWKEHQRQLEQSTLTTHVIPKLRRYYGVDCSGVGYYRHSTD